MHMMCAVYDGVDIGFRQTHGGILIGHNLIFNPIVIAMSVIIFLPSSPSSFLKIRWKEQTKRGGAISGVISAASGYGRATTLSRAPTLLLCRRISRPLTHHPTGSKAISLSQKHSGAYLKELFLNTWM